MRFSQHHIYNVCFVGKWQILDSLTPTLMRMLHAMQPQTHNTCGCQLESLGFCSTCWRFQ